MIRVAFVGLAIAATALGQAWALDLEGAKRQIADRLRDPESVRFRGLYTVPFDGELKYLCGYVNARNAFGGYTGFLPFAALVHDRGGVVSTDFGTSEFNIRMIQRTCGR